MTLTAYFVGGSRDGKNEPIPNEDVQFEGYRRVFGLSRNSRCTAVIYGDNSLDLDDRAKLINEGAKHGQFHGK